MGRKPKNQTVQKRKNSNDEKPSTNSTNRPTTNSQDSFNEFSSANNSQEFSKRNNSSTEPISDFQSNVKNVKFNVNYNNNNLPLSIINANYFQAKVNANNFYGNIPSNNNPAEAANNKYAYLYENLDILNPLIVTKYVPDRLKKHNLSIDSEKELEFYNTLESYLKIYLKQIITNLVKTSRIRNSNFSFFSKNSSKTLKRYTVNTFNPENNAFHPYKTFDILYTRSLKNEFNLIEEFSQLNSKKAKIEHFVQYKSKMDEIAKKNGGEANITITSGPNPIKLGPGRRTGKKDSAIIKTIRTNFAKTQKKEENEKLKCDTQNTLDTFLDSNPMKSNSAIFSAKSSSDDLNKNSGGFHTIGKDFSFKDTYNLALLNKERYNPNEINISIYKDDKLCNETNLEPILGGLRKVTLKDFVHYIESCNVVVPLKSILLQKAMIFMSNQVVYNSNE